MEPKSTITTSKGVINIPAYLPVTTFGGEFPLDELIRPFLPRYCDMLMVSYQYAIQMEKVQKMPVFIDSGGFAVLLEGSEVVEMSDGLGSIKRTVEEEESLITPSSVLDLQQEKGQWGSTLDFPITPSIEDSEEKRKRIRLTLANAQWALKEKKNSDLRLFGSVQGWDESSYMDCARELLKMGFVDLAIGGLVPRVSNRQLLKTVVSEIRSMMGKDGLLHAFGMGEPELVKSLFEAGASSVDSSSFVRAAASAKRWDGGWSVEHPSGLERAHIAISNLMYAQKVIQKRNDVHVVDEVDF